MAKGKHSRKAMPTPKAKTKALRGGRREQWRYAWRNTMADFLRQPLSSFLTVMVVAISLTLPSICYIVWKNVSTAAEQWYPTPQLTVYLDKSLDDSLAQATIKNIEALDKVEEVNYLSSQDSLVEFRSWSGFSSALDMLEENPLPAVAIVTPVMDPNDEQLMVNLRDAVANIAGVDEVRMDDSWFTRLSTLTSLVGQIAMVIGSLMIVALLLVIGNSVRLNIFSRRDTINVMKLIGATDGFIMRPFLNWGLVLGFIGAIFAIIFSALLVWKLSDVVTQAATVFGTTFSISGLGFDESVILILVSMTIGWFAAWLTTMQHLRQFTPE